MSKQGRQYGDGFRVLRKSADTQAVIKLPVAASTTITKGDMIEMSSGYAQGATAFSLATKGIAKETVDNSAGAAGAKNVLIDPLSEELQLLVQVEADALVTQAAVGTVIDLESADGVDIADTTVVGFGFHVDEIDVSTEAVAANTFGYVIGRVRSK